MKYYKALIVFYFLIDFLFAEFEKDLQLKLILAEPGDTIKLDAGLFPILGTLSMEGKQNIVIKGSGTNSTILNFKSCHSPFFADFKTDKKECDCSLDLLPEVNLSQTN